MINHEIINSYYKESIIFYGSLEFSNEGNSTDNENLNIENIIQIKNN